MFQFNPISKQDQTKSERLKSKNKNFTEKVKAQIFERDDYKCVRCGTMNDLESVPHHITYKSQNGQGTLDNGATVCRTCHILAHSQASVRKWFEDYRSKYYL
jgi:5-methylcytosine-specific restriction endonuclease McrA